jgi:hypothetical protein
MAMLIVDLDAHEMNIVQVSVNPDQLSQQIMEHRHGEHQGSSKKDDGDTKGGENTPDSE